jgi:UDP-3-O-[3-hydroxymyristoyl] glucosamine N-acyltransferase
VGTAGHLSVGDGTILTAQSGVPNDVPPRSMYSGYPAVDNRQWLKMMASLNQLPELRKRVRELESEVGRLRGR